MSASYVATPTTSIDATVKLRMVGTLADYTAAKLDSIKSDLAQMLRIGPYMFSLSVEAAVLPATGASWPPTTALGDGLASSSMVAERTHSMREPSLQLC